MSADPADIAKLTDRELGDIIRSLTIEIAAIGGQLELLANARTRSFRLLRSTVLMAGGLFAATMDVLGLILSVLGLWDWIDAVSDDATITNRQAGIKQHLADLDFRLALATLELRKRKQAGSEPK